MFRLICLLLGYAFGLFQTAFVIGKLNGIDIREHGSGNAGTTNTLRVLGTKAGLLVFLGDCIKCIVAVLVCSLIFKSSNEEALYLIKLYAGLGCILGHNFPFYMGFKGGKGVACTAGLMIAFDPWFTLVGVIVFFSIFFITHYVSLGSLMVYPYILIMEIVLGFNGYFAGKCGCTQKILIEMCIITFVLLCMTTFLHRTNIKRLISHTERKTYLTKKSEQ